MKLNAVKKLHTLPYFTKNTLRIITEESDNTLSVSVNRMLNSGKLIKLKNGFYVSQFYFEKNRHLIEYREFLANALCQPSYLSLEYVLGKYDILTEGARIFTSVTLKTTRSYENSFGSCLYKNIAETLFTGYKTKFFADNTYYIASKVKALFDYLYFLADIVDFNDNNYDVVNERRLRIELFTKDDWEEMLTYLKIKNTRKIELIKLKLKPYAPNL